jgi:hypothetical protein
MPSKKMTQNSHKDVWWKNGHKWNPISCAGITFSGHHISKTSGKSFWTSSLIRRTKMDDKINEITNIVELQTKKLIGEFCQSFHEIADSGFSLSKVDRLVINICNEYTNMIMNLLLQLSKEKDN